MLADRAVVETKLKSPLQCAAFLAAAFPHSGDWLSVLPISSCSLQFDDEAVRVAVTLRLGLPLCAPCQCHFGALVDAREIHSFVCKCAPGKTARHHELNELIARLCRPEYQLTRSDGKRQDGLSLIPWQGGKPSCWDLLYLVLWLIRFYRLRVAPQALWLSWPLHARSWSTVSWTLLLHVSTSSPRVCEAYDE